MTEVVQITVKKWLPFIGILIGAFSFYGGYVTLQGKVVIAEETMERYYMDTSERADRQQSRIERSDQAIQELKTQTAVIIAGQKRQEEDMRGVKEDLKSVLQALQNRGR